MKKLTNILLLSLGLLAMACKPDGPQEKPKEEPQAPVIESAQLRGENGEATVLTGAKVVFTAEVSVKGSELGSFSLEISNAGSTLASCSKELSGTKATISETFDLGLVAAEVGPGVTPTVYLKVVNKDKMATEYTLKESESVKVVAPEYADFLYLVDNNGHVYQMTKVDLNGIYHTDGDISELGTNFRICSKINGTDIDSSGEVWGPFDTPSYEDCGNKWISFDIVTGEIDYMLDLVISMDTSKMAVNGANRCYWAFKLVHNCQVVFYNFGDNLQLQADRFDNAIENTARYTGHTGTIFEVYYIPDSQWLVVKNQWSDTDVLYITGASGSLPMLQYDAHPLAWFGDPDWASTVAMMKDKKDGLWRALLFLKENFALKAYDYWAWGNELTWTSASPDLLTITPITMNDSGNMDGNYGVPGPSFTEGLYMIRFNKITGEASMERFTGTIPTVSNGEAPGPGPGPGPDPTGDGCYLVDVDASAAWEMTEDENKEGLFVSPDLATVVLGDNLKIVSAVKDGAVAEGATEYASFTKDPVYKEFSKNVWKIAYNKPRNEYYYKVDVWAPAGTGEDEVVTWVLPAPKNSEFNFLGFTGKVSEMVNKAIFSEINDAAGTARYIGVGSNYEVHYNAVNKWLFFNALWGGDTKDYLVIGNNASFPQAPYTDYPLHDDFATHNTCGGILHLNQVSKGVFQSYIYVKPNFNLYIYGSISWGDIVNGWTSATPSVCVLDTSWEGFNQIRAGADLTEGLYLLEYDSNTKKVSMTSESTVEPAELILEDGDGHSWPMPLVSEGVYCTGDLYSSTVGESLRIARTAGGPAYVEFTKDPVYKEFSKNVWKIAYNKPKNEYYYKVDVWAPAGTGEDEVVTWVLASPKNSEFNFLGFTGKVSEMVNKAIFSDIDDAAGTARYIGVGSNYEVHYNAVNKWLFFNALWGGDTKDYLVIGNNASFPQSPYTEYPLHDDFATHNTCGGILHLNQVKKGVFQSYIYVKPNFNLYIYGSISWGDIVNGWTSATPSVCVLDTSWEGFNQIRAGADLTEGVYLLEYNANTQKVSMTR